MAGIRIGYFDNRGFIHAMKLVLEYAGVPYTQEVIPCGPAPTFDKEYWHKNKHEICKGFDFPNLPFYEDEGAKITHHLAIMQHLGRKFALAPKTPQEVIDVDICREEVSQLEERNVSFCYAYPIAESPQDFVENSKKKLVELSGRMEKTPSPWFACSHLTYVDFLLFEVFDQWRLLFPGILDESPAAQRFMNSFEGLPNVTEYLSSDRYKPYPLWSERSSRGRYGPYQW